MFYMSEYLECHRQEYYDRLLYVAERDDWQGWIEFFLNAMIQQSKANIQKAKRILELYEKLKPEFLEITHSQFAIPLLDAFFQKPILDSTTALKLANIKNRVTGNALLKKLQSANIILLLFRGSGNKASIYALPELINIVEDRNIF